MKWTLEAVNDRLKAGKVGVKVEVRGIPSTLEIEQVRSLFDDRPDWQLVTTFFRRSLDRSIFG
ncbi:hypothetical protein [Nostoc sp. ChiSLP03a]|uniref:hypothetical protein n=1 Tax=Nostoc sp. ChiSLP03a TaxID=3075380 RepID=UPI002AD26670|nr:hypothetical protein [Nostoc sp. ChiSLP03a]MDZ8211272.1 hypothetical protein [Nostoc sp. ChiSLP03a]